jgi:hypothetical protein
MSTSAVDQQRFTWPSFIPALSIFGVGVLFASAAYAAVTGAWSDGVSRDQSFARVLVVGISPDLNQRCPFERAMASKIKSASTVALVSCDVMPLKAELTRESIEAAVRENNADAVLATSLISQEWEAKQGATADAKGGGQYKAIDSYYGVYGTVVAADFHASAPITTVQGSARVTSKLYETRGATVIYTVDTTVRRIETRDEGLSAVTTPIAKRLRKDGLIR